SMLGLALLACSVGGSTSIQLPGPSGTPLIRRLQDLTATATPANTAAPQAPAAATTVPGKPAVIPTTPPTVSVPNDPGIDRQSQVLEAVYAKVNPSVILVANLAHSSDLPRTADAVPQGEGSGFVWDASGHIVTNDHVVRDAERLQAVFPDGTTIEATLVGTDPDSDVAVIKVDPSLVTLIPVEQGNIDDVKVGQKAIAIGNPFGFAGTMTQGIVSAVGRSIPAITGFNIPEAIQTDAAINPGNSGGPLLNEHGQVIGINAQIRSDTRSNTGVGFAIPINIVQRVVPALIKTGHYQHAYLGVHGGTYSRAWADALGLPANLKGAYILDTIPGAAAARAGLHGGTVNTKVLQGLDANGSPVYLQRGGDLIVAVDGKPITKMDDLLIHLERYDSPGQTIQVTVVRSADGKQVVIPVKLDARPAQSTG
ncbi:MAG TPA: trypsin-like peptidase domain-containing protein, partial [Anaerolineae bacterium]